MSASAQGEAGGTPASQTPPIGGYEPADVEAQTELSGAAVRGAPTALPGRRFAAWRMGLVVSASALCGGIAVVLWNRRLLAHMRETPEAAPEGPYSWEDDA